MDNSTSLNKSWLRLYDSTFTQSTGFSLTLLNQFLLLKFQLARCREHSAVPTTELLQPMDIACWTLFQSSCTTQTSPMDCSDNSWRDTFFEKHEHGALWLLICGALEKHLHTYLLLQFICFFDVNVAEFHLFIIPYVYSLSSRALTLNSSKPCALKHKTNIKSLVIHYYYFYYSRKWNLSR